MTSILNVFIAISLMALVVLATRAFPFLLFSRRNPPSFIRFIEKFIPPMVMAVLVVYCLRNINWTAWPSGIAELSALALVVVLHLWKKNAMLSIFGGTAFYMFLISIL